MLRRTFLQLAALPLLNIRFKGDGLSLVDLINAIKNKQYYKLTYPPDQYIYWSYYREKWASSDKEFRSFVANNFQWFMADSYLLCKPNPEYVLTQKPSLDVSLIEYRRKLDLVYKCAQH